MFFIDRYDEPLPVDHRIEQHDMGVIAQLRLPDIFLHYEPIIQQFRTLRPLKQGMSRSIPCMSVIQRYVGNGGISQISVFHYQNIVCLPSPGKQFIQFSPIGTLVTIINSVRNNRTQEETILI